MKGVILAGGFGTRLLPMTRVTNKHLLPVYDRPMVYFPIESLVTAGVKEILLVTGGNAAGDFVELLGNGEEFGLRKLSYAFQKGAGGIAEALGLAEDFADGQPIAVILGDNIFQNDIAEMAAAYRSQLAENGNQGARIALKDVKDPQRFGVPRFDGVDGQAGRRIVEIVEKPQNPPSMYAVVGLYMYDASVFDIIKGLKPSARNELEITDVNNAYLKRGQLEFSMLQGWWSDAGTIESLHHASSLVARLGANGKGPARKHSSAADD
ncbi:MAG: NTP transferase domain-containing protein [Phycisphaerales bacterium]|nr:NTP transferase domain-containing protein [Phycisphaerales bacterium]